MLTSSVQGIPSNSPRCMIRQELSKLNTSSNSVLQPSSLPLLHSHINHSSSVQLLHHSHYNQASQVNLRPHSIQREPLPTTPPFIVKMQLRALLIVLWLIIQFKSTQALPVDTRTNMLVHRLVLSSLHRLLTQFASSAWADMRSYYLQLLYQPRMS